MTTRRGIILLFLLAALAAVALPARAQSQAGAAVVKPSVALAPAEAQRVFQDLLQRYFEAYARKDIEGMAAFWHPGGPARVRRNVVVVEFDLRQVTLAGVTVQNASADAGGGRARALVELSVTNTKTKRTRHERRVRDFTFLPDEGGAWKIWNEVSPAGELARQLLAVPASERDALLAARPELASDDALTGLSQEAGRLQAQQKAEAAIEAIETQSRLARSLGDLDSLGRALTQIGSFRMMAGRHAEAADAFTAAREAYASIGNTDEVAGCDANLANLAYTQGRFAEAGDRYQRALEVFEQANDDARMVSALHGLGNTTFMQLDFQKAIDFYTRAMTIAQRLHDAFREGSIAQALAMVHKELGDYAAAADAWRRSLALAQSAKDENGTAKAWAGLADMSRLQGDLARALEAATKSLEIWERLKNAGAAASSHYTIGQLHALGRNFPRAIDSYQKALALDISIIDDPETSDLGQARDLGGLGGAHFALGQPDVALGEYERSLVFRQKRNDELGVMWTLTHMGVLHASQSRFDDATKAYERALAVAEPKQNVNGISTILALRSRVELDQGRAEAALASAARAVDLATGIEHFDTVAYARTIVGRVHQKAGRTAEARAAFEAAVDASVKTPIGPAADTFFDNRLVPYTALVDLLGEQGNAGDAFTWSERRRLVFLGDLFGGGGAAITRGLTAEERNLEQRLARDLRAAEVKLRRARSRQRPDAERIASLQGEASKAQSDVDALRRRLYEAHPELRQLRAQAEAIGPDQAGKTLAPASAVVSFVVDESRTWAFLLAREGSPAAWTAQKAAVDIKAADLAQDVRRFREAVAKKDETAAEIGGRLRTLLLGPFETALARKPRLIVLPDGVLWSLPFEALPAADGRYLVEDHVVSYAPSLTALAAIEEGHQVRSPQRSLVAFGRPQPGKAGEERLGLVRPGAPTSQAGPVPTQPDAERARADDRELQAIRALFAPGRSTVYAGEQARPSRLAEGVAPGSMLHLAVPVVLTEGSPLYSLIALTPSDPADPSSGLVEAAALMTVSLPADAIVTSRVEYGPAAGEGDALTALAWSLVVAGSPALVFDRWLAGPNDPNVAVRFYRAHNAAGTAAARAARPSESLQRAMKAILARPATKHPFYWAGYGVIGR